MKARALRILIVDDEPLARDRIRSLLETEPDVDVVGECSDGAQAVREIRNLDPDLLFLDVQMPRLDGFEVLEALQPGPVPVVVFTTAHDQHALAAFEHSALDYLLKPFTEARFRAALQRARTRLERDAVALEGRRTPDVVGRIFVRTPERILFLRPDEISRVEAAGNYVLLHVGNERHVLRETLSAMETRLGPSGFFRISRSLLVNLAGVREVQPSGGGGHVLVLRNGVRLDMTCPLGELQARLGGL